MTRTITKLEVQRRNTAIADVHVDGEPFAALAWEVISTARLRTGDSITEEVLAQLLAADECWRAKQSALSLLAVRARARGELGDRLRGKGYGDASIEYAMAEVERLGFIDDAAFAESWVRDRLRLRPRGSQALVWELGRKRVSADVARAAVARVMSEHCVSDDALCIAAAERWVGTHTSGDVDARSERRLTAYLARRGYGRAAIRSALDATLRART